MLPVDNCHQSNWQNRRAGVLRNSVRRSAYSGVGSRSSWMMPPSAAAIMDSRRSCCRRRPTRSTPRTQPSRLLVAAVFHEVSADRLYGFERFILQSVQSGHAKMTFEREGHRRRIYYLQFGAFIGFWMPRPKMLTQVFYRTTLRLLSYQEQTLLIILRRDADAPHERSPPAKSPVPL
jgi:hypothetical protein